MSGILAYFVKRPKVVNLILFFVLLAGFISAILTQNQGYPKVDFGYVTITTVYPGASPEDVELLVTNKIEDELIGISGIKDLHSSSMENMSIISIAIEEDYDIDEAVDDIRKAVDSVTDLPDAVTQRPVIYEVNNDRIPVIEIAISGPGSYETKRSFADALEKRLRQESNVGTVDKIGYLDREIKIEAFPEKLKQTYVSLDALYQAIQQGNFRLPAGELKKKYQEKKLLVMSEFDNPLDVKDVIIRSGFSGNRVRISDVAQIVDGYEKPEKMMRYKGQESINVFVQKKENADMLKTAAQIKKVIEEFQPMIPKNTKLDIITDYSVEVKDLLDLVIDNAKLGLVFVLLFLVLFLNLRVAFWTSLGIPFSILGAFILLPVFDVTINFITLMGIIIVLGMVVDDAILVAENIYSYREKGLSGVDAAVKGVNEVLWPVITSVLTTIVAFSPMIAMTGVMGKFMYPMPIIITLVLLASLLESLFLLPSHIAHSKMTPLKDRKFKPFKWLENYYRNFIIKTLRHRWFMFLVFFIVAACALMLAVFGMKFILFPNDDGLYGVIKYELPTGYDLIENAEKISEVESVILSFPESEIDGFVTGVGEAMPPLVSYGNNVNSSFVGNIIIYLTPTGARDRRASAIFKDLQKKLANIKGFTKLDAEMLEDGPPVGKAITLTFVSDNDQRRTEYANLLKDFLSKQAGVSNIEDNEGEGKRRVDFKLNYDLISELGLTPYQVAETIRMSYDGLVATTLQREGEEIDFRVQLTEDSRSRIDTIRSLTVQNASGKLIPLNQLIHLVEQDDVQVYNHEDGERSITIYGDVDDEIITSREINKRLLDHFQPLVDKYTDIRLVIGGEEKDTQESMQSLLIALVFALVGIYFILVILFNSYSQPFLVMTAIPYSFVGVIFAFYLHNMPLSFTALIGMIGLMGVVVNNSLVMISFLNTARDESGLSIPNLAEAATRRLRPIVLTSLTTAAGLFPTSYGYMFGFGNYNPVIIPMIRAVAWGLLFSTVITLILIPGLYLTHEQIMLKCRSIFKGMFGISKE